MKIVIGLGNPGKKYENTRHNVGFMMVDHLAAMWDVSMTQTKFKSLVGEGKRGMEKVLLVKPQTYMNLSGEAVRELVEFFKPDMQNVLIIYDDLDLPVGKIRLRAKGSAGGHNGMKSIIAHLGTDEFNRMKIGIDRPDKGKNVADYVLSSFTPTERPYINEAVKRGTEACDEWVTKSFLELMNRYNGIK